MFEVDEDAKQQKNAERKDHPIELIRRNQSEVAALDNVASSLYPPNPAVNSRVELFFGNIATLNLDAIVNAANESLLGGGGVDQAIHKAAGPELFKECERLPINNRGERCAVGEAKITRGHNLQARYVVHTVAPLLDEQGEPQPSLLKKCYESCLAHVDGVKIRSIAFCCLGTGFYGYPIVPAAKLAMGTVREWMEDDNNIDRVNKIVFAVFTDLEQEAYTKLFPIIFPPSHSS